jgi:hypothetical protein
MTALPLPLSPSLIGGPADVADTAAAGLRRSLVRGVLVLAPGGVLDRTSLRQLDQAITADDERPVAIDLTECTLAERSVLDRLDPPRWARTSAQVCVICNRLSGRQLMARAGVIHRFSLFARIEDALQSRVLADSGYGTGWAQHTA